MGDPLGNDRREPMRPIKTLLAAGLISAAAALPALAIDISGAGATFPYPIYAKWADAYKKETGNGLNYQSIGSGGGIKQIVAKTVTFGASDMPLKAEQLEKDGLVQFPTVLGGVVPVINIEGIKPGDVVLDGPILARIFLGEVKSWNDPAIQKLNPSAKLPAQPIVVVHRSDGSGTTFLFTDYLSKASAEWKSKVGANTAVEWPVGIGAKGNEGVANNIAQTKGSIGYVEYAYAKQNKLTFTNMVNKDGKSVAPTAASFMAAAANAKWDATPGFGVVLTDEVGAGSWPIAGATFILMHKQPQDPVAAAEALKFFAWAYAKGDQMAETLDYVPMPDKVVGSIQKVWAAEIKDKSGKPLFAAAH
jgi:phosphate transport system substrate-binding protein